MKCKWGPNDWLTDYMISWIRKLTQTLHTFSQNNVLKNSENQHFINEMSIEWGVS